MSTFRLDRLLEFFTSIELVMGMFWLGLAIFTVGLAVLMYTRWGQYKPLRKCMGLSLLAHLLLAGYAATVEIVTPMIPPTPEPVIQVSLSDKPDEKPASDGSGRGKFFPPRPPRNRKSPAWSAKQPTSRRRAAWFASSMQSCPVVRRWNTRR
jgi:hypothetical protein